MKEIKNMDRAELAAFVQEHLRKKEIEVVLSGGACVSIYSNNLYVSMDLDLINTKTLMPKRNLLIKAMKEIGFERDGRYFVHKDAEFFVEFPAGPLAIGEEPVNKVITMKLSTGILKIISPTDSVKDRLTWYYHDNDLQCLEQAVLIAQNNEIDIAEIKRWSIAEGKISEFLELENRLLK